MAAENSRSDQQSTEKELDEQTGLTYFGARYLDAELGSWTATDPMGQYHHSYSFVGGNPINYVDLWGLEGEASNGAASDNGDLGHWDYTNPDRPRYVHNSPASRPPEPSPGPQLNFCCQETPKYTFTDRIPTPQQYEAQERYRERFLVNPNRYDSEKLSAGGRDWEALQDDPRFQLSKNEGVKIGRGIARGVELTAGVAVPVGIPARLAVRFAAISSRLSLLSRVILPNGGIKTSTTVARQLAGPRNYIPTQSILDAIGSGTRIADPQGVAGQFMYRSAATFNKSSGTLEVLVHEASGEIRHVLFRSGVVP